MFGLCVSLFRVLCALVESSNVCRDELVLSLGKDLIEGLLKRITAEASCSGCHSSEHGDRCEEHLAEIGSNIRSRHRDDLDVCSLRSD